MTDQPSTTVPATGATTGATTGSTTGGTTGDSTGARSTPEMVVLSELADSLIADLAHHPSGRTARTVLSGPVMRAVVIALRDGSVLAEHDAPSSATLYLITGRVTLRTVDREWPVYPGQLIPIPPHRHAVEAHADSAFLLTVALH